MAGGIFQMTHTRQYRNFMAKLYGWGASVVIIGALFKINHYTGANLMLIIGLGTESLIFFFSAFEPPHVEPDWSLVYPQLAGMYHGKEIEKAQLESGEDVIKELDKMLEKAKIGPELIESLGQGLRNLSETTAQLSDVSNASIANDQYVKTLKGATESASVLSESYKKSAKSLDQNVSVSEEHLQSLHSISKGAATLSSVYDQASQSLKEEIALNKNFSTSIKNATTSADQFVQRYNESAEILSKSNASLSASATEGTNYNKQLQKISGNMAALNSLYELYLQGSGEQVKTAAKTNETMAKLALNLDESVITTSKYKDTLAALNKVFEQQLQGSAKQAETSQKLQEMTQQFLGNLHDSVEKTAKFKEEMDSLAKNLAGLNRIYGNMLSAINIPVK
jgi:gliding motility-associated protein GldL